MKIGLIDVDNNGKIGKCFPNIALMKLSNFYKSKGHQVEWYDPMFSGHCDKVYMSNVFSFSQDYMYAIDADEIVKGGSGYCIRNVNGREVWTGGNELNLPYEIEHSYPDYELYGIKDTAYGFMSRGCPRGCDFCHVKSKEGLRSRFVANLNEFWNGQKFIELMDPNTFACDRWEDIIKQLQDSGSYVNFNQGVDIRILNSKKSAEILKVKTKGIHFAFDRYEDRGIIEPKLAMFKDATGWDRHKVSVYILCNFNTTLEQDLKRVMYVRRLGFQPYVMLYEKYNLPKGHIKRKLQRWVNNKFIFWKTEKFEDYINETIPFTP